MDSGASDWRRAWLNGVWGQRFSPGTFLANFPPDSGLIYVAVELGWIGLLIFLNLYFNVLIKGSSGFWRVMQCRTAAIAAAIVSGFAPLLLVETSQEVVCVFPMSLLFWDIKWYSFSRYHALRNSRGCHEA